MASSEFNAAKLVSDVIDESGLGPTEASQYVNDIVNQVDKYFPYFECARCEVFVGSNHPGECPNCGHKEMQKSYRESQKEIIVETAAALQIEGYDNVIIEAPTGIGKCLSGDTLVATNEGYKRIVNMRGNETVRTFDDDGFSEKQSRAKFEKGEKETIQITTERGYTIEGTPEHKLKVLNEESQLVWMRLGDLDGSEKLPINRERIDTDYETLDEPEIAHWYESQFDGNIKVDEQFAELLGWFVADGNAEGNIVRITTKEKNAEYIAKLFDEVGLQANIGQKYDSSAVDVQVNSVQCRRLFEKMCYSGENKRIPDVIFSSPVSVREAFINGLYSGDGTYNESNIALTTVSEQLSEELQQLLLTIGVASQRRKRQMTHDGEPYTAWWITVSSVELERFHDTVGEFYSDSQNNINVLLGKERNPNLSKIPNVSNLISDVWERYRQNPPTSREVGSTMESRIETYRLDCYGPKEPPRKSLIEVLEYMGIECESEKQLRWLCDLPVFFDGISEIEESEAEVYDLNVPETHNYVANGFVSHNSAVNYTLGRLFEDAFYTTPQKSLRDQLDNDDALDAEMHTLRGRRDYTCGFTGDNCEDCDVARGTHDTNMTCRQVKACTYWNHKEETIDSKIAAITFAYLIVDNFIPTYTKTSDDEEDDDNDGNDDEDEEEQISFDDRDVVIVDEAQTLANQVASLHAGFKVTPGSVTPHIFGDTSDRLRALENKQDIVMYDDVKGILNRVAARASSFAEENKNADADDIQAKVKKCESFLRKYEWVTETAEDGADWVASTVDVRHPRTQKQVKAIELQPVRVSSFLDQFVWSRGRKRVISTATMPHRGHPARWVGRLGLPGQTKIITSSMPFDKDNRPIHTGTIIDSFSNGGDKRNWDEIVSEVNRLASEHRGEKGLIHTSSYDRAERLVNSLPGGMAMMDRRTVDSTDMVEKWQESDCQILCSPAMTEGVDLKGDMCRWQILLKVPFADSRNDSRVAYMLDELNDWDWYYETAGLEVFQSIGRAVRSKDDWADYYVFDKSFNDILKNTNPPKWVTEAIDDKSSPTADTTTDALSAEW